MRVRLPGSMESTVIGGAHSVTADFPVGTLAAMHDAAEPLPMLLIDDDELSREILELLLGEAGYAVEVAGSGEEALAKLRSGSAAAVVLADLQMPGLSGTELAFELRRLVADAPGVVLAMSGSEPKPGSLGGYDGFLLKPFTMEQLALAIDRGAEQPVAGELITLAASAGEGEQAPEVLDEAKLEQLRVSFRPAQMDELFCFALADAKRQLETMQQALAEGDDVLYRRCAHSMKGSFGMLGAPELRELGALAERDGLGEVGNGVVNEVTTLVLFSGALSRLRHTLITRGICHC